MAKRTRAEGGSAPRVRTGGHLLVKVLQSRGVDFVFGTTGAGMPDIQDAMVVEKPPKWIQGLHEFPTVSAAAGYALASEACGVSLIDRVVGTQNCVGALYGAYLNSAAVAVLCSSNIPGVAIPTGEPEYHYYSRQSEIVSPWLKWHTDVNSLETLQDDVIKALDVASTEHHGITYVTLRQDLMARQIDEEFAPSRAPAPVSARVPDDETVDRVVSQLLEHDRPRVATSHLGRRKSAVAPLVSLAEALGLAVTERRVFMSYPVTNPMFSGFEHPTQPPRALDGTDLVFMVEMGLLPPQRPPEGVQVIDMTSDPLHRQDVFVGGDYGSSAFPAAIRMVCDTGPALAKIAKRASTASRYERVKIAERRAKVGEEHERMVRGWRENGRKSYEKDALDGWSAGYVLNKFWSPDTVWVNGSISQREPLAKSIELSEPGSYFGNPSAHLGVAPGMAYGVSLAYSRYTNVEERGGYRVGEITPSTKTVICTTGDGDAIFGNIDSALWTCSHYGIGVLFVITNNACWGIEVPPIENSSQHWAKKAGDFEFVDLDSPRIDFCKIAEAFRVPARRVGSAKEFESSLKEMLERVRRGGPALIDLQLEKQTGSRPSVVP